MSKLSQEELVYVVKNAPNPLFREAGLSFLLDTDTLLFVAKNDDKRFVREKAIQQYGFLSENSPENPILVDIALNDPSIHIRESALNCFKNDESLMKVALNYNDERVFSGSEYRRQDFINLCESAVDKMSSKNQDLLAKVVKNSSIAILKTTAVKKSMIKNCSLRFLKMKQREQHENMQCGIWIRILINMLLFMS